MATAWLTASEMRAWRNFIESVGTLTAALESDLVQFGLTMGDYEVLVRLSESEDQQLRMCDLSTALQLSPSGLTRRLDGLVKTGLVERIASPSDRRVMFAALTPAGHAKLVEAAPDHVASVRKRFFKGLSRDQVRALGDIFESVRGNLTACPQ
ncbi:MAG TPA: MarR family transcriptional regulator [Ilumatobacteraceae bacterium]|jgi:DNA-binding MarR family transcriptional regulator|nr:MarR family transcriptional regulator [Ilumatobacteraceae bacterium]